MGRKRKNKENKGEYSSESSGGGESCKVPRHGRTPPECKKTNQNNSVSDSIRLANSVLFNETLSDSMISENTSINSPNTSINNSVFEADNSTKEGTNNNSTNMSDQTSIKQVANSCENNENVKISSNDQPTNYDIMRCLKSLESKVTNIDKRLVKLERLDSKIDKFEEEMKKIWIHVNDQNKKADERLSRIEEKADSTDFSLGLINDKVVQLESERNTLREEVIYLQSQSMRNNLIFGNIPEADQGEETEGVLKTFLVEKLKLAQEFVDEIQFERVHRMGYKQELWPRKIVAKFNLFKEREYIRKQSKVLKGTDFFIHEQFPKEVNEKRKKLLPQLKEARKANKTAWLAYDTLYIEGKAVQQND